MGNEFYSEDERKIYYVSVQTGQLLEEEGAAGYELVIKANREELTELQELFEQLSTVDEAQTAQFGLRPFAGAGVDDEEMNKGYDQTIQQIYKRLYDLGTDSTKRHIESMRLF
ncbi:hypothetical protein [Paenibacillus sp. NPDC058071]|uniref:hypothetical protein n=1 Tax=Paenibacillus sp. NPDC058071 TaxID=3346326 RepID=UPI0036D912D0